MIRYNNQGGSILSYVTTGGHIEVYFFFKGTAKDIIKNYQNFIGLPRLQPFWALGWHSSSYGYNTSGKIAENIMGYSNSDIPLEGVWLDIPYMDGFKDFTVDQKNFGNMKEITDNLIHKYNRRLIPIIDLGIIDGTEYAIEAQTKNALIWNTVLNETLKALVWANRTVFLDWFNDNSTSIWKKGI